MNFVTAGTGLATNGCISVLIRIVIRITEFLPRISCLGRGLRSPSAFILCSEFHKKCSKMQNDTADLTVGFYLTAWIIFPEITPG